MAEDEKKVIVAYTDIEANTLRILELEKKYNQLPQYQGFRDDMLESLAEVQQNIYELKEQLTTFQTKYPYTTAFNNSREIAELKDNINVLIISHWTTKSLLRVLFKKFEDNHDEMIKREFFTKLLTKLDGSEVIKDGDTVEVDRDTGELIRKVNEGEKSVEVGSRFPSEKVGSRSTDSTPSKRYCFGCEIGEHHEDGTLRCEWHFKPNELCPQQTKEPPDDFPPLHIKGFTTVTITYDFDRFKLVSREDLEKLIEYAEYRADSSDYNYDWWLNCQKKYLGEEKKE